ILKVTIEDCLGCKQEHIQLPTDNNVHLLLYKADNPMRGVASPSTQGVTPVVQALKLLCTKEYATAASLQQLPQLQVGQGCVKMSFSLIHLDATTIPDDDSDLDMEPSTSRQAHERQQQRREQKFQRNASRNLSQYEVAVVRRFDDVRLIDRIMIQINGGQWVEQSIVEFCDFFFMQPQHMPQMLLEANQLNPANWMKIIQGDRDSCSNFRENGNPFETFAKLFHHEEYEGNELLEQLVSNCLFNMEALRLCERRFVLTVFEDVRQIFEYITCKEYTVWFFVPRLNRFTQLEEVNVNDFDLSNVHSSIKLVSDVSPLFWDHADHNIMDLLHVSFQLALAKVGNQTVLFLSQLEKVSATCSTSFMHLFDDFRTQLAEFTTLQYTKAFFMNKMYTKDEYSAVSCVRYECIIDRIANLVLLQMWICHRYLHRIIEVSQKLQLAVFIEYPRGLTLLPEPRPVIKCNQHYDKNTDTVSWNIIEDVTKVAESHI
ncbi:hypothetical protein KR093_009396, partial [Drosophila rubida]